jgi:hypothetical protein
MHGSFSYLLFAQMSFFNDVCDVLRQLQTISDIESECFNLHTFSMLDWFPTIRIVRTKGCDPLLRHTDQYRRCMALVAT